MLKILDRYLLRHFFSALVTVIIAIGLTIVVINMVEELRAFIDHNVSLSQILEYYLYFAGWVLKSFLPMFVLLAVMFSVSMLARKQELLAMKASGRSLYRLTLPFILVTTLIAGGHFYYNEYIYPDANKKKLEIKKYTIEKRSRTTQTQVRNIRRQINKDCIYTIFQFDVERQSGSDFRLYKTGEDKYEEVIFASKVIYQQYLWMAIDGVKRTFTSGSQSDFLEFDSLIIPAISDKPKDLAKRLGEPGDMGIDELRYYISLMKRTGGPYTRELVDLEVKYAFPISSIIVVLISIPFASHYRKGGVAVSFAVGTLLALTYFVLFRTLQSAGYNGKIPVEVAAWGVNGLFLLAGMILMIRAPK